MWLVIYLNNRISIYTAANSYTYIGTLYFDCSFYKPCSNLLVTKLTFKLINNIGYTRQLQYTWSKQALRTVSLMLLHVHHGILYLLFCKTRSVSIPTHIWYCDVSDNNLNNSVSLWLLYRCCLIHAFFQVIFYMLSLTSYSSNLTLTSFV